MLILGLKGLNGLLWNTNSLPVGNNTVLTQKLLNGGIDCIGNVLLPSGLLAGF